MHTEVLERLAAIVLSGKKPLVEGRVDHHAKILRLAVRQEIIFASRIDQAVGRLDDILRSERPLRPGLLDRVIADTEMENFTLLLQRFERAGGFFQRRDRIVEMEEWLRSFKRMK